MKNNGFIKNLDLLEETYKIEDLLDFSSEENKFKIKLSGADRNSVFGLVAPFGSGKSTLLENMARNANKDELWVNFDAWKFPDRKELWEGFVLDSVKSIDSNFFDSMRKKIDGEQHNDIKKLINTVFECANCFIPGFAIGKNFSKLFKSSPARRVFEFQEVFKEFIEEKIDKKYKKIYFVVEDIDRSGDKGIFFLETLKYFLAENDFNGKLVNAIVPIATDNYNNKDANISYRKVLDYIRVISLGGINYSTFIENVFEQSFYKEGDKWIAHYNFLFKNICKEYDLTIRDLKHVLRNANAQFISFDEKLKKDINVRFFVLFSFLKYLEINNKFRDGERQYIHNINHQFRFNDRLTWARHYMSKVMHNFGEEMTMTVDVMIVFKDTGGHEAKYVGDGSWLLSDFYKDLNVF